MTSQGKFIVIEGTDGSGKKTQIDLLRGNLKKFGKEVKVLDFPEYYKNFWGATVGRYLSGEFGELSDISPYLISPHYLLDQASAREDILKWKNEGRYILANRYITSSMGHQTAKLPRNEQEAFLTWLMEAGYKQLGLIKEDLVIVLYMPVEISAKLVKTKDCRKRKKYRQNGREIAEEDLDHQKRAAAMYLKLCEKFDHWHLVKCINEKGKLKSKEEIQKEILKVLMSLDIFDEQLALTVGY